MPAVTHPIVACSPSPTELGFATRTMAGFATCTVHDAEDASPLLVQVNPKFATLEPMGGGASTVLVAPEISPPVTKPLPILTPEEHPHVMASVMPTSAICGWQESSAVGGEPVPDDSEGTHCQPVTQFPVFVDFHVPFAQPAGSGCAGVWRHS